VTFTASVAQHRRLPQAPDAAGRGQSRGRAQAGQRYPLQPHEWADPGVVRHASTPPSRSQWSITLFCHVGEWPCR
jgi:hypothetical protein